jgi:UDP-3-O-[3-hydroxymyristoyl] glucosamine N-acyltransferase
MGEVAFSLTSAQIVAKLSQGKLTAFWANPALKDVAQSMSLEGVRDLKDAGPRDIAFFFSSQKKEDFIRTRAGLVVTGPEFVEAIRAAEAMGLKHWSTKPILVVPNPYLAFALATKEKLHFLRLLYERQ